MITHRCEGSLKHGVSIRFTNKFGTWKIKGDYETWRMFKATQCVDYVYDGYYLQHITEITYCPFCGERLKGDLL